MGVSLRRSRADNSILSGPMWTKFELLLDIMQVPNTYKFKMDQMNSNLDKVATLLGRIWPNFKLSQALMYVIITCKYEKELIKNS